MAVAVVLLSTQHQAEPQHPHPASPASPPRAVWWRRVHRPATHSDNIYSVMLPAARRRKCEWQAAAAAAPAAAHVAGRWEPKEALPAGACGPLPYDRFIQHFLPAPETCTGRA